MREKCAGVRAGWSKKNSSLLSESLDEPRAMFAMPPTSGSNGRTDITQAIAKISARAARTASRRGARPPWRVPQIVRIYEKVMSANRAVSHAKPRPIPPLKSCIQTNASLPGMEEGILSVSSY